MSDFLQNVAYSNILVYIGSSVKTKYVGGLILLPTHKLSKNHTYRLYGTYRVPDLIQSQFVVIFLSGLGQKQAWKILVHYLSCRT